MATPILEINNIVKHFDISGGFLDQIKFKNKKFYLEKSYRSRAHDKNVRLCGQYSQAGCF